MVTTLGVADALPGTNTVDSGDIINGQVKTADIQNGGVRKVDIATGAVVRGKIRNNAVNTAKIADGSIANQDIADSQINSAKVADGSLTGADIADNSLTTFNVQDGTLGGQDIADGQIGNVDIATNAINGSKVQNNTLTGADISEASLNGSQIPFACSQPGIANFWAHINGDATFTTNLWYNGGSGQLPSYWNCSTTSAAGSKVRKVGNATFDVYFANSGGPFVVQATPVRTGGEPNDCLDVFVTAQRVAAHIYRYQVIDAGGNLANCPFSVTYF